MAVLVFKRHRDIQQTGHARHHLLWLCREAGLHVIRAKHQRHHVNRPMRLQRHAQGRATIHDVTHDRVIILRGPARQAFLDQFPASAQGGVGQGGPTHAGAKAAILRTVDDGRGAMSVAVAKGQQDGHEGSSICIAAQAMVPAAAGKAALPPWPLPAPRAYRDGDRDATGYAMFSMDDKTVPQGDLIKDSTEATFMQDVIEASREVPVIVDFWATWCGPCRTLGPALEAAVKAAKGKVRMVKVDVDKNQMIAAQLRIQSIPTVYAFWQGQPVDGFQGAIPASEIKAFIDKLTALTGEDGGLAEALEAAEQMLAEGAVADAAETFAAILGEEPENAGAYAGLIRCHLALDQLDQAEAMLTAAPPALAKAKEIEAARAQLELARQAANAGPEQDLRAAVQADPQDRQARFDLALALHAAGKVDEAVDVLLDLFKLDREWNDGAARTQLMTIFEALKPTDPIALKGRRRLSSMIFA